MIVVEWKLTTFLRQEPWLDAPPRTRGVARLRAARGATGDPTRAWWRVQPRLLTQKRGQFLHPLTRPVHAHPLIWPNPDIHPLIMLPYPIHHPSVTHNPPHPHPTPIPMANVAAPSPRTPPPTLPPIHTHPSPI